METMKLKNIVLKRLEKAQKLVEKGWIQRDFESEGRYCIIGALNASGKSFASVETTIRFVLRRDRAVKKFGSLIYYNDCPSRNQKQVINLFKRTIGKVKNGHFDEILS